MPDKKEDFLKQCEYSTAVAVTNNTISLEIANIKTGVYSVSLFHDENNNGVLELSLAMPGLLNTKPEHVI